LRLDPVLRYAAYAAFSVLFVTGAAWLFTDQLKDAPSGEAWQLAGSYLLMIHGGGAMLTLLLLGALFPLHVQRGWRGRCNRLAGSAMLTCNAILILTAFGLYYAGAELLRPWLSSLHTVVGLGLPLIWAFHVVVGRRLAAAKLSSVGNAIRRRSDAVVDP
jgi:hypothetical protein